MLKVFKYFRPIEWVELLICVLLIMLCVYSDLKVPDYMSNMTTLLTTPGTTTDDIWGVGIFMIIYSLISFAATIVVILLAARIASGVSFNLRHLEFEAVEGYSMTEINRFSTSSLINRSTNDITQVQFVIALGTMLIVRAPVMCIWAISKIVDKDWHWTATTAVAVVIMLGIMITIVALVFPKFKRIQSLTDDINRLTEENLTGIRVVRAYNAEGYQTEKFEETNTDLTGTMLFSMRTLALLNPVMMLIMNGLTLAVYWVGAGLINAAGMADKYLLFSDMVVFSAYAIQIVMSFLMLVMIFILLPRASVAARRIAEVIETPSSIKDGDRDKGDEDKKGTVEFRNVSFRYADGGANVLSDISFKAEKGETVAIIGSTGSGKSTIINLIPRFYDATEGEVLVDGVNVKDYTGRALRKKIGYVSQRAVVFRGTIRSNIEYGDNFDREATDEELMKAVRIAQADDFVSASEDGLDTDIAQAGQNLSGGQKQRLSIARAVARNAEIYIFDDSFSALDYRTDKILRKALSEEMSDATKIIVAQRIGTIKNADRILVIDEGRIVGEGTHDELMKDCEVYREIAYSQLSKEELD